MVHPQHDEECQFASSVAKIPACFGPFVPEDQYAHVKLFLSLFTMIISNGSDWLAASNKDHYSQHLFDTTRKEHFIRVLKIKLSATKNIIP